MAMQSPSSNLSKSLSNLKSKISSKLKNISTDGQSHGGPSSPVENTHEMIQKLPSTVLVSNKSEETVLEPLVLEARLVESDNETVLAAAPIHLEQHSNMSSEVLLPPIPAPNVPVVDIRAMTPQPPPDIPLLHQSTRDSIPSLSSEETVVIKPPTANMTTETATSPTTPKADIVNPLETLNTTHRKELEVLDPATSTILTTAHADQMAMHILNQVQTSQENDWSI